MNLNCYLFETWLIKDMSDLHYYKIHFNSIIYTASVKRFYSEVCCFTSLASLMLGIEMCDTVQESQPKEQTENLGSAQDDHDAIRKK